MRGGVDEGNGFRILERWVLKKSEGTSNLEIFRNLESGDPDLDLEGLLD